MSPSLAADHADKSPCVELYGGDLALGKLESESLDSWASSVPHTVAEINKGSNDFCIREPN